MYERFYNLRERPFALSPDPEYLYLSRVHREALDSIRYGIESRAGFIVVTGDIGAGKTTLLQTVLQRLDERTVIARIVNTTLNARELLESILLDFGLDTTGKSKPVLLRDLGQFLVQQRARGRRPLLVIDEAQNLSAEALEEVRLLSNLETEKSKLLQILLVGQPTLRDTIASPQLEQFRQRVAVSYHLTPLDARETAAYINYRLEHAALGEPPRFPPDASDLVHRLSGGVPRIINVICDATLVFGYAEERRTIDRALLEEVMMELEATGVLPSRDGRTGPAVGAPAVPLEPAAAPATPLPAAPAAPVMAAAAPGPAIESGDMRDRAIVAAREPAAARENDVRQEAAAREAELARQRELVSRRQSELAAREEALLQRERQIAEQRRIMSEEYRLLRSRAERTPAASGGAGAGMSLPSPAMTGGASVSGSAHMAAGRSAVAPRHVPFWQRIFRIFAGEPALRS
jgi:putative secretion ATPase (PEP-CTERM system associated)